MPFNSHTYINISIIFKCKTKLECNLFIDVTAKIMLKYELFVKFYIFKLKYQIFVKWALSSECQCLYSHNR